MVVPMISDKDGTKSQTLDGDGAKLKAEKEWVEMEKDAVFHKALTLLPFGHALSGAMEAGLKAMTAAEGLILELKEWGASRLVLTDVDHKDLLVGKKVRLQQESLWKDYYQYGVGIQSKLTSESLVQAHQQTVADGMDGVKKLRLDNMLCVTDFRLTATYWTATCLLLLWLLLL